MNISIISFHNGCTSAYYSGNLYNDEKVIDTIDIGFDPTGDHPLELVEMCRKEIRFCAFDIANAYAKSVEAILSLYSSYTDYVNKNWRDLRTSVVYVTYTNREDYHSVKSLLDGYGIQATYYMEQHLMALSCDYRDDYCCRILYENKFSDAHYTPYVCAILDAGQYSSTTVFKNKVEKTLRVRNEEIVYFLLACATQCYFTNNKRYPYLSYELDVMPRHR